MEETTRYRIDQYGNDDYAQLDSWSPHIAAAGYKASPNDNTSLIYTSDYGSYSSQESNHSGTTYSNLADCEEALHGSSAVAYDVPPPLLFGSMEKRRDKPLPPPRMTSKVQSTNKTRFLEPVKEKKISFDDSSVRPRVDSETKSFNDSIPSFATLPRKKKPTANPASNSSPIKPTSEVTWMKEVAQKGELIARTKSANPALSTKKPHGILKNKVEEQSKRGDTTGYIKHNTVQRILNQQKKALNRQSPSPPSQMYKSMPTLRPATMDTAAQLQKAWEYNHNENNSGSGATAQVIGVLEPSFDGSAYNYHHSNQHSSETEMDFPPPPSEQDMEQLLAVPSTPTAGGSQNTDFTPLNRACYNRVTSPREVQSPPTPAHRAPQMKKQLPPKPPVPLRSKKTSIGSQQTHPAPVTQIAPNYEKTIPPRVPPKRTSLNSKKDILPLSRPLNSSGNSYIPELTSATHTASSPSTDDLVLPPPPEFQEMSSPLLTEHPSYGDYELLAPDSQCTAHPAPRSTPNANENYHHRVVVDQLQKKMVDTFKLDSNSHSTINKHNQSHPPPSQINGYLSSHSVYRGRNGGERTRFGNHHHQYSTEL